MSGCRAQARASARRCCWPPESARAGRWARVPSPTLCRACWQRASRCAAGTPCSHSPSSTFQRTDRCSRNGRWNTMALMGGRFSGCSRCSVRGRSAAGWAALGVAAFCAAPCRLSVTRSAACRPCSRRKRVVLPEPLAPTRARRSPRNRRRFTSCNARVVPKLTLAACSVSSGASAAGGACIAVRAGPAGRSARGAWAWMSGSTELPALSGEDPLTAVPPGRPRCATAARRSTHSRHPPRPEAPGPGPAPGAGRPCWFPGRWRSSSLG